MINENALCTNDFRFKGNIVIVLFFYLLSLHSKSPLRFMKSVRLWLFWRSCRYWSASVGVVTRFEIFPTVSLWPCKRDETPDGFKNCPGSCRKDPLTRLLFNKLGGPDMVSSWEISLDFESCSTRGSPWSSWLNVEIALSPTPKPQLLREGNCFI